MKLILISCAPFKAIILINGLAYSQPAIQCAGKDYSSLEKNKEYYELLFAKTYFLDDNWVHNLKLEFDHFSLNFQGNTYKLPPSPTTITPGMCQSAFNSIENGACLFESLLVMYETNHNKAYINWAMDLSLHWISMRGIVRGNEGYSEKSSWGLINHNGN
jgi:hypothetical protein